MAFSLIANTGASGVRSSPQIDTSGANLIVINVSRKAAGTLSDNKSNTWTGLTEQTNFNVSSRLYYCVNPTVGAGHDFIFSHAEASLQVTAWSGGHASAPFDQQNGATGSDPLATGSVTPGENNELVTAGLQFNQSGTVTINGGFTISNTNDYNAGSFIQGGSQAYLVQTTATAANPTWTHSGTPACSATIATFKEAAASGATALDIDAVAAANFSASATQSGTVAIAATSAATFGGSATQSTALAAAATGNAQFNGTAQQATALAVAATGNAQFVGAANAAGSGDFLIQATANAQFTGAASQATAVDIDATGNAQFVGEDATPASQVIYGGAAHHARLRRERLKREDEELIRLMPTIMALIEAQPNESQTINLNLH